MINMPECRVCSFNTSKRVVLKRKPLIDITDQMKPHPDVKKEYLCINKIKALHPIGKTLGLKGKMRTIYDWFEETCKNHLIILNKGVKNEQ